jgi:hypothetical protein
MNADFYILGDADRVRERIERHLLAGDFASVTNLSASLTAGINNLAQAIGERLQADTIMAGGDDVLFRINPDAYSGEVLKEISKRFHSETGCTISFGVGNDIAVAYLNLRRAKAGGGNAIVASAR